VTPSDLYLLYARAYHAHDHSGATCLSRWPGISPIARAIAELAESDAEDGRPMRSRDAFALALEEGAQALRPLGLVA
jgi:hypothetical protein